VGDKIPLAGLFGLVSSLPPCYPGGCCTRHWSNPPGTKSRIRKRRKMERQRKKRGGG